MPINFVSPKNAQRFHGGNFLNSLWIQSYDYAAQLKTIVGPKKKKKKKP